MPTTDPRRRCRSRGTGKTGDPAGRIARPGPRRGAGQGHRDLAQSRRDQAGVAARRAGLAAGLGFRRYRRARGGGRQRPETGARVVGILPSGAWAERVNCRSHAVAVLPDGCSDAQAATLPVAGLTALHALRQGGLLLGRKVLVDGASGGVGHLACQLAAAAGAQVWGHVRRAEYRDAVAGWCDGRVVLGPDLSAAKPHGPFWLIVDSVGASALGAALGMLAPNGTCVTLGVSEGNTANFESRDFFSTAAPGSTG